MALLIPILIPVFLVWFLWRQVHPQRTWWERYEAHLRSPHWHRIRLEKYRQAGGRCEGCGIRLLFGVWQLHHLHYRTLGRESLDDVILVCKPCHQQIHGRRF